MVFFYYSLSFTLSFFLCLTFSHLFQFRLPEELLSRHIDFCHAKFLIIAQILLVFFNDCYTFLLHEKKKKCFFQVNHQNLCVSLSNISKKIGFSLPLAFFRVHFSSVNFSNCNTSNYSIKKFVVKMFQPPSSGLIYSPFEKLMLKLRNRTKPNSEQNHIVISHFQWTHLAKRKSQICSCC